MSSVDGVPPEPSPVGADLMAARHRLGWDLAAVAAGLRIRLPYLRALEDGRIADLPGNAYAVGFLRTYASALGLDADEMARRFRAEVSQVNGKTELAFPAPVPERGVPAGAVILLGMLLAIGGYVGWYRMSGNAAHRVEPVAAVPERLAVLVDPPPAGVPPTALTQPPAAPPPPSIAAALPPAAIAAPAAAPLPPATPPAVAAAAPPQPVAPLLNAEGGRMVLRARNDAWVQVRDRQGGPPLLNRVLRPNETWPVPNRPNLLLTTGNAGATDVLVDGQPTPGFGGPGVVRRDIPLDADLIKAGRLPVQLASNPGAGQAVSTGKPAGQ
jgi:cytoskeleton protein RodZ